MPTSFAIIQEPGRVSTQCQMHCLVCFSKRNIYSGKVLTDAHYEIGTPVKMQSHILFRKQIAEGAACLIQTVDPS